MPHMERGLVMSSCELNASLHRAVEQSRTRDAGGSRNPDLEHSAVAGEYLINLRSCDVAKLHLRATRRYPHVHFERDRARGNQKRDQQFVASRLHGPLGACGRTDYNYAKRQLAAYLRSEKPMRRRSTAAMLLTDVEATGNVGHLLTITNGRQLASPLDHPALALCAFSCGRHCCHAARILSRAGSDVG